MNAFLDLMGQHVNVPPVSAMATVPVLPLTNYIETLILIYSKENIDCGIVDTPLLVSVISDTQVQAVL